MPVVVIVGPTCSGKTRLALELAERVDGEVISCDSQQVYIGMDIGTGKATAAERARVPHHLLDVVRPDQHMTAARFVELADRAIADVQSRGKAVIVCGGTGLYVRALLLGLFESPPADVALRAELAALGVAAIRAELERVDPAAAAKIQANDQKRMIRAIEVFRLTGVPISSHQARHNHRMLPYRFDARVVGLAPDRQALYRAIDTRVDAMIENGLEAEVSALRDGGFAPPMRSQQAIGYAELHAVVSGTHDRARAIELIKRNTRHYARRQLSWFASDPSVGSARPGASAPPGHRGARSITWHAAVADVDLAQLGRYLALP